MHLIEGPNNGYSVIKSQATSGIRIHNLLVGRPLLSKIKPRSWLVAVPLKAAILLMRRLWIGANVPRTNWWWIHFGMAHYFFFSITLWLRMCFVWLNIELNIFIQATLRILQTLPDRIRQWNLTPCEADIRNRKELEKIRSKQVNPFFNFWLLSFGPSLFRDAVAQSVKRPSKVPVWGTS